MKGKVNCTCGWNWNKSDSSKKDLYICHQCGRDNSNNMKNGGWLNNYDVPQAQDGIQTLSAKDKKGHTLLFKETENAKKDKHELMTTGQIKNPRSVAYKSKVKKQPELNQDNRTDYEREYDRKKGQAKEDKKQFKKNILAPLDVATDLMQVGNFVPHPIGQTIGKVGNILGAGIDAIQAIDDVSEGDYGSAAINAGSVFLPIGLESKTFRRNSKYLQPGQPLYPLSPQANLPSNVMNAPRVQYIEPFTKVKGMTDTSLLANRALLGTLGAETTYDTAGAFSAAKQKNGGWLDNYNDSNAFASPDMVGDGFSNVGRNSSPAWGGQFEDGGEIPNAQKGKKVKYVESKNDPRYKAYQDSLSLYNQSIALKEKLKPYFNTDAIKNKDKVLNILDDSSVYRNYDKTKNKPTVSPINVSWSTGSPLLINASGRMTNNSNMSMASYPIYKKPQQQVIVQKQKPVEQSFTNNLQSAGLVQNDLNTGPVTIQQPVRIPQYYDVVDTNNQTFGGGETFYKSTDLSDLNELPAEGWSRKTIPHYQNGGDVNLDAMRGMMKSKIGMGNVFGHPAIKRMSQAMPKTGMTPEGMGTHYMGSVDNYARPFLQDTGKDQLEYFENPKPSSEDIKFNSPEEAEYFAEHYKEVAPMSTIYNGLQEYQMGGSIPGAVGFTYARTKGIPSEGKYAKKTLPSAQKGKAITKREDFEPWWNWASRKAGDVDKRQDAFGKLGDLYAYYAGQPLHYNVLENSEYKPTNSKNPNAKYISINDSKFKQEVFDKYNDVFIKKDLEKGKLQAKKINDNTYSVSGYTPATKKQFEEAKKLNTHPVYIKGKDYVSNAIGRYFISKGKDEKGDYISYYDTFDEGSGPDGGGIGETLKLTKPFEIYDRIYIDPKTGKPKLENGGNIAQNGKEMQYYQNGLDFQPKTISKNGSWLNNYNKGGVIKDDRGQWDHPGEITEIGSNQITMQGVPYDVLGISDTGDTKLMKPGKDYKFKGNKVTEFPMAKNGLRQEQKGLVNLDDLTNFTNYNKPTKGCLDNY